MTLKESNGPVVDLIDSRGLFNLQRNEDIQHLPEADPKSVGICKALVLYLQCTSMKIEVS